MSLMDGELSQGEEKSQDRSPEVREGSIAGPGKCPVQ